MKKGVKNSTNKPPVGKLFKQFPNALKAVAMCSMFGHLKYEEQDKDWLNYQRVEGQDYVDAIARHLLGGEGKDEQSKLPHKFHVAWNALADLEKHITDVVGKDVFNRSNEEIVEFWESRRYFSDNWKDEVDDYDKKNSTVFRIRDGQCEVKNSKNEWEKLSDKSILNDVYKFFRGITFTHEVIDMGEIFGDKSKVDDMKEEHRLKKRNSIKNLKQKTMNSKFNFSYELSDIEQKAFKEWKDKIIRVYGDEVVFIYHISSDGEDSSFAITSDHSGETILFENDNTTIIGK